MLWARGYVVLSGQWPHQGSRCQTMYSVRIIEPALRDVCLTSFHSSPFLVSRITRAWLRAKYSETTRFETIDSAHLHMTVSATQAPVSEKLMEGFRK